MAERGWIAPHLAEELPGLGISWTVVEGGKRRSPEAVRVRLRDLSDRFYGSHAIHMRERPIPWAYRVFFRHIGLDPDETRTPVEQLALDRLHDGAFVSHGLPDDAVTLATVETGIALRVFDADEVEGSLCIRDTAPGETLPNRRRELLQGTLVVADEHGPIEPLFGGQPSERHGVNPTTRRVLLAAIQVKDVPDMAVDEALWIASSTLESA